MGETKVCKTCHVEKSIGEFYPNYGGKTGHRTSCKGCAAAIRKASTPKKPCEQCGMLFTPDRAASRFCSRQCSSARQHPDYTNGTKLCAGCGEEKPLARFERQGGGLRGRCKDCRRVEARDYTARTKEARNTRAREYNKERRASDPEYGRRLAEKAQARWQKRMGTDPDFRARVRQQRKEQYDTNRDYFLGNAQRDYLANREARLAYRAQWKRDNATRVSELNAKRRAIKLAAQVEDIDREAIIERDGHWCYLCGGEIDPALRWPDPWSLALDHVIPLTRGGEHSMKNLRVCHASCNSRKNNRLLSELDWYTG